MNSLDIPPPPPQLIDPSTHPRYRAAELKHGRVCMLASVGYIVQGLYHLPDGPFEASKPLDAIIKVRR
jgi:hypothetical protein